MSRARCECPALRQAPISQAYVDFAVVSGSQSFTSLRLIKLAYDIACQYMVHFLRRLRKMEPVVQRLPSVTTAKLPEVQGCVGKFHVNGHIVACRTFQSPNYLPGNGRVDGEGSEREWDLLNPSAKATQEMTPGHRHDSLNSISSDLNVRQLHKMRTYDDQGQRNRTKVCRQRKL